MEENNKYVNKDLVKIKKQNTYKKTIKKAITSFIYGFGIACAILICIGTIFHFNRIQVSGDSMYPNLLNKETVMTYKLGHPKYKRGQVIVFNANHVDPREIQGKLYYVKRVIATPGDTVAFKNNKLYVNNKVVKQNYISKLQATKGTRGPEGQTSWDLKSLSNNTESTRSVWNTQSIKLLKANNYVIPEHMYFVMGDNRGVSNDSRYYGLVPDNSILGIVHVWINHDKTKINNVSF